jgi:ribonuclease E
MSDTRRGSADAAGGAGRADRTDAANENENEERRAADQEPGPGETGSPTRPKIGDTRAAPGPPPTESGAPSSPGRRRNRKPSSSSRSEDDESSSTRSGRSRRRRRGNRRRQVDDSRRTGDPVEPGTDIDAVELDDDQLEARRGKHRNGKPVGRYLMAVHKTPKATQIAVLEGRTLIEHYVSRPADDVSQIHGNIYLARVANVLPGMEAAFVDIGTPKNAVLYRSDVSYDPDEIDGGGRPRIEDVLEAKQTIVCQVTKNPIGVKGARLTQEVSLPGRFVVLVPNSGTYGISKRLPDNERKRLRKILDGVKPKEHGVIVRTAAEGVTAEEIENDVERLVGLWDRIDALARESEAPTLLYREPDLAVRVIREEFSKDYRAVVIDDRPLYDEVQDYVAGITPALADRVQHYDSDAEGLPLFERHHVHEQLHRALDRKVWLPSGGSLIIEHTEALTVIDVNTGKNVGRSSLEDTVYANNLEAAEEVARQLRLRDIGGIIVIDFIDMEVKKNRDDVSRVLREALARDKTRTQVFDISELGLVEMTRKRIGEGLLVSFTEECDTCDGRGVLFDQELLTE